VKLITSESMQKLEKRLVESYRIPTQLLMENAGRNIVDKIRQIGIDKSWNQVAVVCGPGNNGGDGLVIARHLNLRYPLLPITIFLVGNPERLKNDTALNYEICQRIGLPIQRVFPGNPPRFDKGTLIIDSLFGTGLSKKVEGVFQEVIDAINKAKESMIIAVDAPSGVDVTWGKIMGRAVKAHHTITFGMLKRGLVVAPAREYCGTIHLTDIGIPLDREPADVPQEGFLITPDFIRPFLPEKAFLSNKISAGVVMVVAGSPAMTGAGLLTCQAAYRSGAGMVIWATNHQLAPLVKSSIPEVVSTILSSNKKNTQWKYLPHHADEICEAILQRKCRSIAIGPGLGSSPASRYFIEKVIEKSPIKGVIDADALNAIAVNREFWKNRLQGWILTPHEGEMGRLLNRSASSIAENRIAASCALSQYFNCITVLKGPGTIVVSPQGEIAINPTGNPNLATAGSGDVLTGIIAAFLAQGGSPFISAVTGVFLHGLSADLYQKQSPQLLASELASYLPYAIKVVKNCEYRLPIVDGD
jgi:hydroxyethylthiazole kinase-like uncharacterized protein yjeF